ncbi:unnamed protein product [Ambrosiozyma monospora]|uniref:Unnamed protein product n=1 Tax=Ambrosiozyma monospora TaxID=43982 RepID=A0ACB5SU92_AMBMO|nr:unnamed protein product [Ambrosiozyma monospora]
MTTTNIQATVSTFLRARFSSLTFQLESWFSLTEKSKTHSSFAQSVTLELNSLEAPDQELIKWIQLAGEATQRTAMSFSSSSRRYYQAHKEEKLIVPIIGGTATRLDSKNPPIQVQEKFLTRRIMPPLHMVKVDLCIHILIKFSTHIHSEQARKILKVDIPECPTVVKLKS